MHSSGKSAGAGRVLEHEVLGCIGPMIQSRDETLRHFVVVALETMREYCSLVWFVFNNGLFRGMVLSPPRNEGQRKEFLRFAFEKLPAV